MANLPEPVAQFLRARRIAVAGVSRKSGQPANAVFRKLRDSGFEVFPVSPKAPEIEGVPCYPDVGSVPVSIDGAVVATHPYVAVDLVRQCDKHGVRRVWFHRSFGPGSVSEAAIRECRERNVECIVGGCPLMYCEPVDFGHRCMRWWLERKGRLPL